ncbi:uracil-DNA glycosylase family protein [Polaribacter batillariae]|uniref:Uracil-DNA glycosylase family protein n=1 Tax=Polaribacter batillariae TaxID=2808900 RepID=A0ABX7SRF5_9FLAO|nr:uracil-DNA glycosylase family protein [Polaribacter batillariae]QTD36832.1 uracil-DNA glycosylase family protein [Polaribacter batillariae]
MKNLLSEIKKCTICEPYLDLGANPVVTAHKKSKIVIVGQAPGTKVHASGIAWNDASGKQLRKWLNVSDEVFYNTEKFAIIPMGFCYPGKGKSGDKPPRKECAPQWHTQIFNKLPNIELVVLIGMYAQNYYLKDKAKRTLTETVDHYPEYLPDYFVLPHPSPRNRFWLTKNPWFEKNVVPELQKRVLEILKN